MSCTLFSSSVTCACPCQSPAAPCFLHHVLPFMQAAGFCMLFHPRHRVPWHCLAGGDDGFAHLALAFCWSWGRSRVNFSERTIILFNAQYLKWSYKGRLCTFELQHTGTQQIVILYCDIPRYCLRDVAVFCSQWISAQTESTQVFISLPGLSWFARRVVNLIRYSIGMPNHCKFSLISFSSSFWCMLVATAPFPYQ